MLAILEATQAAYGYLPVAALKRISQRTGAWYAMIYGTATLLRPPALRAADGDRRRPPRWRAPPAGRGDLPRGARRRARRRADARRAARRVTHDRPPARRPTGWPSILLARADAADPTDLDAAVAAGAFDGPAPGRPRPRARPRTIADDRARRGLRGRGGAGFPAGDKWRTAAATEAPRRYVVANGYGADPASHTDRTLMERDPYAVIEGAGHRRLRHRRRARRSSPSGPRTTEAIAPARGGHRRGRPTPGFIGADVLGSRPRPVVEVRPGPGRLHARRGDRPAQGPRGQARPARAAAAASRPSAACSACRPSSTTSRPWPPCRWILRHGADAFAAIGDPGQPGHRPRPGRTPGGDGHRRGPARDAAARRRRRSAARCPRAGRSRPSLVGGPSGGLLPARRARHAVHFEALRAAGAHLGSGSVVAVDDRTASSSWPAC